MPRINYHHSEETKEKIRKAVTGWKHTDESKEKMSIAHLGHKLPECTKAKMRGRHNKNWKGDMASYKAKHGRIISKYGTPQLCENCGVTKIPEGKKWWFEWANISREYKYERSDWKRLCVLCHRKMDAHLQPRGEKSKSSKLKQYDIVLIRELLENSHISMQRIGRLFNVSGNAIYDIKNNKTWKHIS